MTLDLHAIGTGIILAAAVAAALGYFWRIWGRPVQHWLLDIGRTVKAVDEQLKINGCEDELPIELRNLPLRTLVIRLHTSVQKHVTETAPLVDVFLAEHPELQRTERPQS